MTNKRPSRCDPHSRRMRRRITGSHIIGLNGYKWSKELLQDTLAARPTVGRLTLLCKRTIRSRRWSFSTRGERYPTGRAPGTATCFPRSPCESPQNDAVLIEARAVDFAALACCSRSTPPTRHRPLFSGICCGARSAGFDVRASSDVSSSRGAVRVRSLRSDSPILGRCLRDERLYLRPQARGRCGPGSPNSWCCGRRRLVCAHVSRYASRHAPGAQLYSSLGFADDALLRQPVAGCGLHGARSGVR